MSRDGDGLLAFAVSGHRSDGLIIPTGLAYLASESSCYLLIAHEFESSSQSESADVFNEKGIENSTTVMLNHDAMYLNQSRQVSGSLPLQAVMQADD